MVAVATISLLGTGALGAHALQGDPASTSPTAASPSRTSQPASNAGPKNIVQVKNFTDGAVKIAGRVQLGRVPGPGIGSVNMASAFSSCTDCTTLAVALQINMFNRNASVITPQNAAVAINGNCTRCDTEAYAFQYNIGVDDPTAIPPRVNQLVAQMKHELAQAGAGHTSLPQAEAEINTVLAQYQDLAGYLLTQHQSAVAPGTSTTPAPSPSPSVSPSPTDATPSPSPEPTAAPSETPSPSPT